MSGLQWAGNAFVKVVIATLELKYWLLLRLLERGHGHRSSGEARAAAQPGVIDSWDPCPALNEDPLPPHELPSTFWIVGPHLGWA